MAKTEDQSETIEESLLQIPRQYLQIAKNIFSCLIGAKQPITPGQLVELLAIAEDPQIGPNTNEETIRRCIDTILLASGRLVKTDVRGFIDFTDSAVKDHIMGESSSYSISYAQTQMFLSRLCWDYIAYGDIERDLTNAPEDRQTVSKYIIRHCIGHTQKADMLVADESPVAYMLVLMERNPSHFERWVNEYNRITGDGISDEELRQPILFCARFGYHKTVRILLDRGDITATLRNKACDIALGYGHTDLAFLLRSSASREA